MRARRKLRIRKKVLGTGARPRLSVFRSARHIYAQVIDDVAGTTVASVSTLSKDLQASLEGLNKSDRARQVGTKLAELLLKNDVAQVVFDRNGYLYHGRIKALADAARKGGLKF
jgi:large subunit ribosomal protein L18